MSKPKIVILRGSSLNSWEMQNYEGLTKDFDLSAVGSQKVSYDTKMIKFPVERLSALSDLRNKLGRFGRLSIFNRLGDRLMGLDNVLQGAKIVHSAETFNVFSHQVAQLKDKYGYKLVLTVWENIPFLWDGVGSMSDKIHRRKQEVISKTDRFIAASERARWALRLEGVEDTKISVVPMGIDLKRFEMERKSQKMLNRLSLTPKDFVILTVCRFSWFKGVQDLIFAAAKLKTEGLTEKYRLKFVAVGDGGDKDKLVNLVNIAGLKNEFQILDKMPYEDMVDLHSVADIFYLGSWPAEVWQEQFGMVLIESMAAGKPVVAAESGSISEVVGDSGAYFPAGDFYKLSEVLRDLIIDPDKQKDLGWLGRQRVEENFSKDQVAEKIKKIYQKIL